MTKQEWKLRYSAFRRLYHGLFHAKDLNFSTNDCSFRLAADAAYKFAKEQHWSIYFAALNKPPTDRTYYAIEKGVKRFQIKNNTYQ